MKKRGQKRKEAHTALKDAFEMMKLTEDDDEKTKANVLAKQPCYFE